MKILTLLCALLFVSCASPKINARTFYTSRHDLASYVLDTPDPLKSTKGLGQLLWIRWSGRNLPSDTYIALILRFTDRSERKEQYPVKHSYGSIMVEIPDQELLEKGTLLSYSIELRTQDKVLATSKHKMWVDTIEIKDL